MQNYSKSTWNSFAIQILTILKLAYFLEDRYLTGEQSQFVDQVHGDLTDFYRQSTIGIVLLFPPVNNFLRLLIHKTVEDYPGLHSFSVGVGEGRQTVVCWRQNCLESDKNQFGSVESSGPWTMRGRGRARYRDGNSSSPGHGHDERWNQGDNSSRQTRDPGSEQRQWRNTSSKSYKDTGSHRSVDRLEDDDRSPSTRSPPPPPPPSSSPASSSSASTKSASTKPGSTSHVKKLDRSKNRRPDVQVYVPKARRQQQDQADSVERSPARSSNTSRKFDQKKANIQYYAPRGRQLRDQEMLADSSPAKKDFWDIALDGHEDDNAVHVPDTSHSRSDYNGTRHDRTYNVNDYNGNVSVTSHSESDYNGTRHYRSYVENEQDVIEHEDSTVHDCVVDVRVTEVKTDNDSMRAEECRERHWNPGDDSEQNVDYKHMTLANNIPNSIDKSESRNTEILCMKNRSNHKVESMDEIKNQSEDFSRDNIVTDTLDETVNNCDNTNSEINDQNNDGDDGDYNDDSSLMNDNDDDDGGNLVNVIDNTCKTDSLIKIAESNDSHSLSEQSQGKDLDSLNTVGESLESDPYHEANVDISVKNGDTNENRLDDMSLENKNSESLKLSLHTDLPTSKTEECEDTTRLEQDSQPANSVNKFEQSDVETNIEHDDDSYKIETMDNCDNQDTNKTCNDLHGNNDSNLYNMDTCVSKTTTVKHSDDDDVIELNIEVEDDSKSNVRESDSNVVDNVEDEDEDSWDTMFNDDGDCLDPTAMEELTKTVGKVKIQKSKKINYLEYQPKDKSDFDYTNYNHIIEIYDFPAEFVTRDLIMAFQSFMSRGFDLKWVDDTHALGIFSSAIAAQDALGLVHPLLKVCPLSQASLQSKNKAKRCTEFLQPYKPRPETSAMAARRLVAGALGIATNVSREKREKERQQLKEAKAKRRKDRQNRDDIWEFGGKCAMDEES